MKSLIAKMAQRKITVDPTLVVAESLYVPENGDLSPAYAPFVARFRRRSNGVFGRAAS